ncbi:hypothetical protein [Enterococcus faecalis]|uniref:hypothetical protein n=1 Tax=Enterococcus faecalis TaxID=1351 RepID=UPI003D7D2A7D
MNREREFVERNTKIANSIIGKMKKSRNDLQKTKEKIGECKIFCVNRKKEVPSVE